MYFRGQGRVYIGNRDGSGNPLALRWVGNCPELKIGFEVENIEHIESYTGQALTDLKIPKSKKANLTFTLEEWQKENLAQALYGTSVAVTAGAPIVDEPLNGSTTPAVGHVYVAAKRNGSLITLRDSTGVPKTLVLNTNYTIEPKSMTITIIDLTTGGPFVGPLEVSYTPGAFTEVAMFNAAAEDKFIRFVGMNLADTSKIFTVDLYKVSLNPASELSMITEELSPLSLEGGVLVDSLKPSSATLGQFGAIYQET